MKKAPLTADQIKQAWKIRKAAAAQHNVKVKFVGWSSCILKVKKPSTKVKDCYGSPLGSIRSKINEFLVGAEAALVIDTEWVFEQLGFTAAQKQNGNKHFASLVANGYAHVNHNFMSLVAAKRPFAQPMAA